MSLVRFKVLSERERIRRTHVSRIKNEYLSFSDREKTVRKSNDAHPPKPRGASIIYDVLLIPSPVHPFHCPSLSLPLFQHYLPTYFPCFPPMHYDVIPGRFSNFIKTTEHQSFRSLHKVHKCDCSVYRFTLDCRLLLPRDTFVIFIVNKTQYLTT